MVETEILISCPAKGFQYGGQVRECRWLLFLGRCGSSVECNLPLLDYAGSISYDRMLVAISRPSAKLAVQSASSSERWVRHCLLVSKHSQ